MLNQKSRKIEVVAPSDVSTNDLLNVDLDDLGLSDENIESLEARIVAKRDSSGNGKVLDDIVTVTSDYLQIQEGSTGFASGDVFTVELIWGLVSHTATAATAS